MEKFDNDSFACLVRDLFDNQVARQRQYDSRAYQIESAERILKHLLQGKNASLELPTGTGKTLIAAILARAWIDLKPSSIILIIIPNRTLVTQHRDVFDWIAGDQCKVFHIPDDVGVRSEKLYAIAERAQIIISTPLILANAIEKGVYGNHITERINLLLIDEFDSFLTQETSESEVGRYHLGFAKLIDNLPKTWNALITSATLPKEGDLKKRRNNKRTSIMKFVVDNLNPEAINIPEEQYQRQVPVAKICLVHSPSRDIERLSYALKMSIKSALFQIDESVGALLRAQDTFRICASIASGKLHFVPIYSQGKMVRRVAVDSKIRRAFLYLQTLIAKRDFLLEEAIDNHWAKFKSLPVRMGDEHVFVKDEFLEWDEFSVERKIGIAFHYHKRDAKTQALKGIIEFHPSGRGIVFVRTVNVAKSLCDYLNGEGLSKAYVLHGELNDLERSRILAAFRSESPSVLVMTRQLGGRGLDLPQADYAIFWSPKSDPASFWQELSRIRSRASGPKSTYLVTFGLGYELRRFVKCFNAMRNDERDCTCILVHEPNGDDGIFFEFIEPQSPDEDDEIEQALEATEA